MAAKTIGTVMIDIKADTSKLIKNTEKAQKYMEKTVGNMKKTVLGLATAYIGVQTAIKGMDIALKQAESMINVAAQFEKFDATLKTISGSSAQAERSMKWIQDFASKTPFNIDKVTSSFISLKSYGLDPTDGLLRTLGDTSAAMGKDIQQAVEAMADAVTGENERLKEYGIRASKMGENIKYSWTNSSGEMRQAIIANNSAIIESTLNSIFNSKYAGAMEEQSHTWNGLISNMQDNWTIFQKNLMDSGVFDYLKAIVTVVGDYLKDAFGKTAESSVAFSKYVIEGLKSVIKGIGYTYDSLETFGDYFKVIGKTAELAFDGVMVATTGLASGIVNVFEGIIDGINLAFEGLVNGVIDSINGVLNLAASLGFGDGGTIGHISLGKINIGGDLLKSYSDAAKTLFVKTGDELGKAFSDLMDGHSGQTFADNFIAKIDEAYKKIQETPATQTEKKDFGDAVDKIKVPTSSDIQKLNDDYKVTDQTTKNLDDTTQKINDTFSTINDTLANDTGNNDTYTVVNNVNDSFNKFNDISTKTTDAIEKTTKALDVFIFKFEDTFLNSIQNNINSLESIYKTSSANSNLSYQDALAVANKARTNLIGNPLDINAGDSYTKAYNQLVSSSDNYLSDKSSFSSSADYAFAQATVGSQLSVFQDTAFKTVNVLDSMNNFLKTINQAFSDGILTDEEKATIAGVATDVNTKNEKLLGSSSIVVAGLNGIPTSIDSQTYYDNTGLATDASLVGTNSISSAVAKLMGSGTKGISLSSIDSSLPSISVNTGLDVSALSSIKTNTGTTSTNTGNTKGAVDTMAGGKSLKNLIIKDVTTRTSNTYRYVPSQYNSLTKTYDDAYTDYSTITGTSTTTQYDYYANGGFTGNGMGKRDASGFKQAGIVHEDEWVAPRWMLKENPALFGALELHRLGKSPTPKSSVDIVSSPKKTDQYLFVLADEMKQMHSLFKRITHGGEAMQTEIVS